MLPAPITPILMWIPPSWQSAHRFQTVVAGDSDRVPGGSIAPRDAENSLGDHLRRERLAEPLHELLLGDASLRRVYLRGPVRDFRTGDHLLGNQGNEANAQLALVRNALEVH